MPTRSLATATTATVTLVSSPQDEELLVYFRFDRSGQWPPVPSEGLRVASLGDGSYRLLETPFFVRNVALDDIVSAQDDGSGVLWAGERVTWGGHQTLRVTPTGGTEPTTCGQVLAQCARLGLPGEELEEYNLVALDVPPGVALQPVKDLLVAGRAAGRWWYEEACVGPAWPQDLVES